MTGSRWQAFKTSFSCCTPSLRDILALIGFASLFYGLWLLRPWIGFSVAGVLLIGYAYLSGEKS